MQDVTEIERTPEGIITNKVTYTSSKINTRFTTPCRVALSESHLVILRSLQPRGLIAGAHVCAGREDATEWKQCCYADSGGQA